jgi:hypothetical protein
VTTGAPIYLVSACSSGEEFVAAFRRYADRTGLFIPVAQPLPVGRRGVLALTLKDGGVMIEGVAEVIASSPKPSALHGRIGMTIRFVETDQASKIMIGELEKARLSMRPAPPSVPPRPAAVPSEPRAVPPPPGGRVDAANALAECVVIGDPEAMRDGGPPKAGQKFVVPSIPNPGGDRPKSPTAPPIMAPPPAVATPPPATATPPPTTATPPARRAPTTPPRRPTPPAPLPTPRLPAAGVPAPPVVATPVAPIAEVDLAEPTDLSVAPPRPTERAIVAFDVPTVDSGKVPAADSAIDPPTDPPRPGRSSQILAAIPSDGDWTMTPDAVVPTVLPAGQHVAIPDPTPAPAPPPEGSAAGDWTMSLSSDSATGWTEPEKLPSVVVAPTPPPKKAATPKTGNPVMAVSSERVLNSAAPEDKPIAIESKVEIDPTLMEPLTPMPLDDVEELAPPIATIPMPAPAMPIAPQPPSLPPMAAMPSPVPLGPGIPPPLAPMPMPLSSPSMELGAGVAYNTPPHGYPMPPPMAMPPPANAMPPSAMAMPAMPPPPVAMPPPIVQSAVPSPAPAPLGSPVNAFDSGSAAAYRSGPMPRYASEPTVAVDPEKRRRKRLFIIIGAAAAVVVVGVLVAMIVSASGKSSAGKTKGSGSGERIAVTGSDGSAEQRGSGVGSAIAPTPGDAGAGSAKCLAEVTTVPPGAEVALDATKASVLGTTPGTFEVPCGVETKLYIRKTKYSAVVKPVNATAGATEQVSIKLQHLMFSVKVTSTPAGATITIAGKTAGVTPTTIKVPAFDASAITIAKDGYAPDTQKVAFKTNNASHHVVLKKTGKRH